MKVSEIVQAFQCMPACERLYLLCQLLHRCITYEVKYIATVLTGQLRCDPEVQKLSKYESEANRPGFFTSLKEGEEKEAAAGTMLSQEVISKLCCALALVHVENKAIGEAVSALLCRQELFNSLEETESLQLLEDIRLVYVMALYHPALSFEHRRLLLTFLQKLDSIYEERQRTVVSDE